MVKKVLFVFTGVFCLLVFSCKELSDWEVKPLEIISIEASKTDCSTLEQVVLSAGVRNETGKAVSYKWLCTSGELLGDTEPVVTWKAPEAHGDAVIFLYITAGNLSVKKSLTIIVKIPVESYSAEHFNVVPIGSITAFHPNIIDPPLPVPDGWMACDGSVVGDPDSPLYGASLPDLNSQVYAGGRGRYLRGGNTSGQSNDSTYWTDNAHPYSGSSGPYYGAAYAQFNSLDSANPNSLTYSYSRLGSTRRFQVTAMTVVWIMRIK